MNLRDQFKKAQEQFAKEGVRDKDGSYIVEPTAPTQPPAKGRGPLGSVLAPPGDPAYIPAPVEPPAPFVSIAQKSPITSPAGASACIEPKETPAQAGEVEQPVSNGKAAGSSPAGAAPLAGGTEVLPTTATAEVAAGYSQEGRPVSPASLGSDESDRGQPYLEMPALPSDPAAQAAVSPATAWVPIVVCAALRKEGKLVIGIRHYDPLMRSTISGGMGSDWWKGAEQGFVNAKGQFLTRQEAHVVAKQNNQIRHRCGGDEHELYSENLY